MEAKITALEDDRNELTSQLVEAKQKQLKLMEKTDAAMERPAQEDYSALKTAKEALETKFVDVSLFFSYFSIIGFLDNPAKCVNQR